MKKTKTDYKKFAEANKRVAEVEAEAEESQKPSARIEAIVDKNTSDGALVAIFDLAEKLGDTGVATALASINAILVYLDEQYDERKRD